jgi:predicted nucleotidyltransferase
MIGASGVHTISEENALVGPLRAMVDPFAILRRVVAKSAAGAKAVLLFGSVARGEATRNSDIDLAVVAPDTWDGRYALEEAVEHQLGNHCDVLVLSEDRYYSETEPVAAAIRADGIVIFGEKPLR